MNDQRAGYCLLLLPAVAGAALLLSPLAAGLALAAWGGLGVMMLARCGR